jgi:hypothetical protein
MAFEQMNLNPQDILAGGIGGAIAGMTIAFLMLFLVMILACYVYSSLALMKIAKRTKTTPAWLAWIQLLISTYLLK